MKSEYEPAVRRDTTLYRGETPHAIGMDLYGGGGSHWSPDREMAEGYARGPGSKMHTATLPATAKRLTLIHPDTGDFHWPSVRHLEKISGQKSHPNGPGILGGYGPLEHHLRHGGDLFDVFDRNPGLMNAIKRHHFDSIHGYSIEGPEEYVLNHRALTNHTTKMQKGALARRSGQIGPASGGMELPHAVPPNHVFRHVRGVNGEHRGLLHAPYDGTPEHAKQVSAQLEEEAENRYPFPRGSNISSRTGATDESGRAKYIISPNHAHIAPVGSARARYILGDLRAKGEADREETELAGRPVLSKRLTLVLYKTINLTPSPHPHLAAERARVHVDASDAMKEAGNYKMAHLRYHGLDITIVNPKGSTRTKTGRDGKQWSRRMYCDYGYLKGTRGKDGDHVDCFVGSDYHAPNVYIVNQVDANGRLDEHKCMLCFPSEDAARACYLSHYPKGWRCGPITTMTVERFKMWLRTGDQYRMAKRLLLLTRNV